jgi:hypothetical protein
VFCLSSFDGKLFWSANYLSNNGEKASKIIVRKVYKRAEEAI